jgi:phosphoglycolate phosphatase-like HAD superfamily hydrolase
MLAPARSEASAMQTIDAILFEPVGCLAEFPVEPFQEIAALLFHRRRQPTNSASRYYWHLLNLIEAAEPGPAPGGMETLEIQAIEGASLYEDVRPALGELKTMGVGLVIASSLCGAAVARFLKVHQLEEFFVGVWSRDSAGGVKAAPIRRALEAVKPERAMFLTDTAEGIKTAKSVGVNAILMMNDPDEARKLALRGPAGGIVSLHELPDFIRLLALRASTAFGNRAARRPPHSNTV